jgi:hypothetical protein
VAVGCDIDGRSGGRPLILPHRTPFQSIAEKNEREKKTKGGNNKKKRKERPVTTKRRKKEKKERLGGIKESRRKALGESFRDTWFFFRLSDA